MSSFMGAHTIKSDLANYVQCHVITSYFTGLHSLITHARMFFYGVFPSLPPDPIQFVDLHCKAANFPITDPRFYFLHICTPLLLPWIRCSYDLVFNLHRYHWFLDSL